ncbi:MAG TPA: hypothetical protein EYQ00_13265 [Dehalococcoidia bacterium]|nr:hypothetical protein [Dehalococcoidia bacterium]
MKVGDQIRLSERAARAYGFNSDTGLIIDKVSQNTYSAADGYPDDYHILINGKVELVGFAIEKDCKVINESR